MVDELRASGYFGRLGHCGCEAPFGMSRPQEPATGFGELAPSEYRCRPSASNPSRRICNLMNDADRRIKQLQEALVLLSGARDNPAINPGTPDNSLGQDTLDALLAARPELVATTPGELAALSALDASPVVDSAVRFLVELRAMVEAAALGTGIFANVTPHFTTPSVITATPISTTSPGLIVSTGPTRTTPAAPKVEAPIPSSGPPQVDVDVRARFTHPSPIDVEKRTSEGTWDPLLEQLRGEWPLGVLKGIMWVESAFNPNARGSGGELGLFQLYETDVTDAGEPWGEYLLDPAENIRVAIKVLNRHRQIVGAELQDPPLTVPFMRWVIGSWNAGVGSMVQGLRAVGPPYAWSALRAFVQAGAPGVSQMVRPLLDRIVDRNYVERVLAYAAADERARINLELAQQLEGSADLGIGPIPPPGPRPTPSEPLVGPAPRPSPASTAGPAPGSSGGGGFGLALLLLALSKG